MIGNHKNFLVIVGVSCILAASYDGARCELFADHVQLELASLVQDKTIACVFKNDTQSVVTVQIESRKGYSRFTMNPGIVHVEDFTDAKSVVTVEKSGRVVVERNVSLDAIPAKYYDSRKRAYYFRITTKHIDFVAPDKIAGWDIRWR